LSSACYKQAERGCALSEIARRAALLTGANSLLLERIANRSKNETRLDTIGSGDVRLVGLILPRIELCNNGNYDQKGLMQSYSHLSRLPSGAVLGSHWLDPKV
jgi:hypothetical protein